jgi:hypothetical protein
MFYLFIILSRNNYWLLSSVASLLQLNLLNTFIPLSNCTDIHALWGRGLIKHVIKIFITTCQSRPYHAHRGLEMYSSFKVSRSRLRWNLFFSSYVSHWDFFHFNLHLYYKSASWKHRYLWTVSHYAPLIWYPHRVPTYIFFCLLFYFHFFSIEYLVLTNLYSPHKKKLH